MVIFKWPMDLNRANSNHQHHHQHYYPHHHIIRSTSSLLNFITNVALSSISSNWLVTIVSLILLCCSNQSSSSSQSSQSSSSSISSDVHPINELSSNSVRNGPRFLIEPSSKIQFLNETGTVITCKVTGTPPIRVWWQQSDGQTVQDINGLRIIRPNGDLVLSPFSPTMFRQDVHSTVYRCMASNSIGTIRSRDCQVRGVIQQSYSVQVYGEYVISGNTGHLKCQIPAFVSEYVQVIAWLKSDNILATHLTPKDARLTILANGDLLIRNATRQDSGYYRCQTRHQLSRETVFSSIEGHFIVNDVISGVSPRIVSQSPVRVQYGKSAELICITKAWPQANVRWFQASESGLISPIHSSGNVQIFDSLLYIRHATQQHSGNWICVANNSLGEERAYIELYVTRPPKVQMEPDYLVADMNSPATFLCNVTQGNALSILWVKDGQPLMLAGSVSSAVGPAVSGTGSSSSVGYISSSEGRIRLIEPHILNIRSVVQEDAGCYQCVVQGDDQTSQAIAELKLGDSPPVFVETFPEDLILEEGAQISLKCSATSTLLPQIRWFLDGQPIDGYAPRRLSMADYVKTTGHVVSFVNITNAKVVDGGEYRCTASNSAGTITYTGRIKIKGPASLRNNWLKTNDNKKSSTSSESWSMMVISGRLVTLICPVIAYPIESLIWRHRSATLPNNHRQSIEPIINGIGGKLIIQNVHRDNDQGEYDCTVKGSDGKAVRGIIKMIVRVAPLIDSQLISPITIANQGMKIKLMCSVLEGDPPLKIKWFSPTEPNNPVSSNHALGIMVQEEEDYSLLTFRSVSIRHMGNWTCKAWNDVLSVNRTTNLVVNVAPSWRQEPKSTEAVLGTSVVLDCDADGYPNPRLIWKKSTSLSGSNEEYPDVDFDLDQDSIDGRSTQQQQQPSEYRELLSTYRRQVYPNGTLWIQEVDKSDSGYYMCQVSNGIGAGLSKVIQLVVQSPPFFATKFLSKSVSKGDTALLECQVQGDPVLHIRWYKDRALINMANQLLNSNNDSNHNNHSNQQLFHDKRYTIKQDVISSHKIISFLQIVSVEREDSTIYTCVAKNNFGNDNTSVQLIVQEVPDPPQSVEVVEVSSRTVQLQWKSPYSGNSPLIRFYIQYRPLNCTFLSDSTTISEHSYWNEISTQSGQELRQTIKGLLPNCHYQFKLSSENQIGRSEQTTNPITVKTLEEVPGGPPTDVQVETTSSTSLKIKWRPPLPSVQFGKIRDYYIGYKVAGSDEPFQYKNVDVVNDDLSVPSGSNNGGGISSSDSYQVSYITNLKRKTTYIVILQAYNSVGPGPRSDEIKISTFDSQPPTSPLLEVVSTTYDSILLKWDSSFQQKSTDDLEEKEYILYFREDHKPTTINEWHQKRIYSKNNQFVLNKDNTQGRIRCGTKYHLYMTATNSLGTGEPSETIIARTKGDTPLAPARSDFIVANATTAILALKSWQIRGCPIEAFTIQYKPIHQKQWIPLVEYLENRDYFYLSHLNPNRDYQLLVSAHSEPGVTRQEYSFHTPNSSAVVRLHGINGGGTTGASASSPMDPYRIADNHSTNVHFRNFTVLLPVLISLMVLIVILGTLFGCLRRQHVNHVVNSVNGHSTRGHTDLCVEHLTRYGTHHNGKEAALLLTGGGTGRRGSQECYPMTELTLRNNNHNNNNGSIITGSTTTGTTGTISTANTCPNSSCDSKSNLLNGNLTNNNNNASPAHHNHLLHQYTMELSGGNAVGQANHFATLNCNRIKLLSSKQQSQTNEQSYYSSPKRKIITANPNINNNPHHHHLLNSVNRSEHEYAEPLQSINNNTNPTRFGLDLLIVDDNHDNNNTNNEQSTATTVPSINENLLAAINADQQQQPQFGTVMIAEQQQPQQQQQNNLCHQPFPM